MADEYGFTVKPERDHFVLYRNGKFQCSGDNKQEIEEEKQEILGQ